jgi:hypothetical protein
LKAVGIITIAHSASCCGRMSQKRLHLPFSHA